MQKVTDITFVTNHLDGGGVEKVFLTLMNEFCRKGLKVKLILTRAQGIFLADLDPRIQVIDLKCRLRNAFFPLKRELKKVSGGSVICGPQFISFMAIIITLLTGKKIRVIATHHSLFDRDVKNLGIVGMFENWLIKLLYAKAYKVVGVSAGVVRYLTRDLGLPGHKVELIYNPVITPQIQHFLMHEKGSPSIKNENLPVVVSVGRLGEIKKFDLLIQAIHKVSLSRKVKLVIVGDGPQRAQLEAQAASLGLSDTVTITGFKSNPYPYVVAADLFVSSSESETFSLVIAEALYLGTRVVATNTVGASEVLAEGKYGKIVPVNNPDAMAEAILHELGNNNQTGCREDAMKWLQQFDAAAISTKYLNLIHS